MGKQCQICDSENLTDFLSLGDLPLSNDFNETGKSKCYPLVVSLCRNCWAVQIKDPVSPSILFENYPYYTSASAPLVDHFKVTAGEILAKWAINPADLVIDIGCNDGTFLTHLKGKRKILGIDAAKNFDSVLTKNDIPHITGFFNDEMANKIVESDQLAKTVLASNVLAHVENCKNFASNVKKILKPDGVFIFEVHHLLNLIRFNCYDQIYHEHRLYLSLRPIIKLLDLCGLKIIDCKKINNHGSSLRIYCCKKEFFGFQATQNYAIYLKEEINNDIYDLKAYIKFNQNVMSHRAKFKALLETCKVTKPIIGYGAPAKCNTLLNVLGIGPKLIDYIVDSSPSKYGKLTPVTKIPIKKISDLKNDLRSKYIVIFSWNYKDYIIRKEKDLKKTSRFIIPFPNIHIV